MLGYDGNYSEAANMTITVETSCTTQMNCPVVSGVNLGNPSQHDFSGLYDFDINPFPVCIDKGLVFTCVQDMITGVDMTDLCSLNDNSTSTFDANTGVLTISKNPSAVLTSGTYKITIAPINDPDY